MPRDAREHRFQAFASRFIDRAVLPPFHATAVDHASVTTDNARARFAARGGCFGFPDHQIVQGGRPVAIELKRGSRLSNRQAAVHEAMRAAGWHVGVARTIGEVLLVLRAAGLRLHGNADNMAVEADLRLDAADDKAKARKPSTRKPKARVSPAKIAAAHRAGVWRGDLP